MGTPIYVKVIRFGIKKKNVAAAWSAIRDLKGLETDPGGIGRHATFSWVNPNFNIQPSFEDTMRAWRWKVFKNDAGDVINIAFLGENDGDDQLLFTAIAPYVNKDSVIEVSVSGGERWRWTFTGGRLNEVFPVWPEGCS